MRILMLAQFYPPITGGEEQHVQILSQELVRRGHSVAVATLHQRAGLADFELDEGVRVYRLGGLLNSSRLPGVYGDADHRQHAPPFPDPGTLLELRRVVARERPEIVHAHNWLVHSFLPLKRWSGAALVLTLHDYSLACPTKRLMRAENGVRRPCSGPGLKRCLVCSGAHYGRIKGAGVSLLNRMMGPSERAAVDVWIAVSRAVALGNGLDPEEPEGAPVQILPNFIQAGLPVSEAYHTGSAHPQWKDLPDEEFLLFVGDVTHDKGVHTLLEAYSGLNAAPPLVLIGRRCADTPDRFPEGVRYLGSWPHAAVMGAWQRASLALVPSVWPEPFGIVVLEAMACGRPVIASRIGGLSDIVLDGETGLLVEPGDVEALRGAIHKLVKEPELRTRMGAAACSHAGQYLASAVAPRVEAAYDLARLRVAGLKVGKHEEQLS